MASSSDIFIDETIMKLIRQEVYLKNNLHCKDDKFLRQLDIIHVGLNIPNFWSISWFKTFFDLPEDWWTYLQHRKFMFWVLLTFFNCLISALKT